MKRAVVFLLLGVASLSAQALPPPPATPTPVIIDTDVGTDLDDAMALGIAFRAQQMGYLRIKAITTSNSLDKAPSFVHTMITYAGYTLAQIPIGAYKGVNFCSGEGDNYAAQTTVALGLVPNASRATFPDALTVLRATLAAAADSSVVIITLGGHGNIAALMQSPADGISPATGAQLWNQKVLRLVAQGGGQPPSAATTSYTSPSWGYNYHCDGAASAYMLSHNGNVPIILNPIEAGILVGGCFDGSGAGCTASLPAGNPVRLATGFFAVRGDGSGFTTGATHAGRPGWDPGTVFFQMVGLGDPGDGPYFKLSQNGTMSMAGLGNNTRSSWTTAAPANHFYSIMAKNYSVFESVLNALLFADFHGDIPAVIDRRPVSVPGSKGGVPDDGRRRRK